jgi:hypothetical protein
VAASVKQSIRIGVFSTAVLVAVLFADEQANADDAVQVDAPSPDLGGGGPPLDGGPLTPPPLPPVSDPGPLPADPTPPAVVLPPTPGGTIDLPTDLPLPPGHPGHAPYDDDPPPLGPPANPSGESNSQTTQVITNGTATANTGGNTSTATNTGAGAAESAQPGVGPGPAFSGTSGRVTTGNATGRGSVDGNGINQVVNATVSEDGKVTVVQVAVIVNIGIGVAGSGGNFAVEAAVVTPTASVAMVIAQGETATGGGGTGPTPATIDTGNANATGNSGTTSVKQSIKLTGDDVANQLASVLNIGVGVANSGLNFALAAVSTNNGGGPQSVTFVTMGGGASISAGPANALGNRSTSTVFQIVTVSASGNGSLLVVQRAIIVNFGLALANSGLNVAGGRGLNAPMPDTANAQQLLLMLLDQGPGSTPAVVGGPGISGGQIGTGRAGAIGNATKTGILQKVEGSVTGDDMARAVQDAWVGNFGLAVANSGGNGAGGLSGLDAPSVGAARDALSAFLAGLTGLGDPVQGLDATFRLGSDLLQLRGDVSGTETLLGVAEPGTDVDPDDAAITIRQVTAVLNIGIAFGDSGHNFALATSGGHHNSGGTDTLVAGASITTGDAKAMGNDFVANVCQAIGDTLTCAEPKPPKPPPPPPPPPPPDIPVIPGVINNPPAPVLVPRVSRPAAIPATLPFTGSPIGAELAAGSGLLIAGMLMARRRRTGAVR